MKKQIACILILFLPLLTGCWDNTEMNDLALVMASGYDLAGPEDVRMTLQIALPSTSGQGQGSGGGGGDNKKPFIVESMTGHTAHDSLVKIQERMSRSLYEGHRRVIVIGEKLARHGIKNILDQFSRDPHSRFRSYIMVAKGMEARDLLQQPYPFERVPAEAIRELEKSKIGFESTVRDYMIDIVSAGVEPVMGVLEQIPNSTGEKGQQTTFHLAGTAIFNNELKLVGFLDDRETRGLLWVKGDRPRGIFTSDVPGEGYVSVEMKREKSKLKTSVQGNKVKLDVQIQAVAAVHENATKLDLSIPKNFEQVRQALSETIHKRVNNVITRTQKVYGLDIFGFGRELHQHNRAQWMQVRDHWNEKFAQGDLNITVDLKLNQMGMARTPLHYSRDEGETSK